MGKTGLRAGTRGVVSVFIVASLLLPSVTRAETSGYATPGTIEDEPTVEVVPTQVPELTPTSAPAETPAPEPTVLEPSSTPGPAPETPVSTQTPEATSTIEATPSPTPSPVPGPFEPQLECQSVPDSLAIAGESEWGFLDCTVTWKTAPVSLVHVATTSTEPGWSFIVVAPETTRDSSLMAGATDQLDLLDRDGGAFVSSRFLLGARLSCGAALLAPVELSFRATIPAGEGTGVTQSPKVKRNLEVSGHASLIPSVSISSVSFESIADSLSGNQSSFGEVTFEYSGASETCGWSTELSFSDFNDGTQTIPASNLNSLRVSGAPGVVITGGGGTFTIASPPSGNPQASSGAITVDLDLYLGGYMPGGNYSAVATLSSGMYAPGT